VEKRIVARMLNMMGVEMTVKLQNAAGYGTLWMAS